MLKPPYMMRAPSTEDAAPNTTYDLQGRANNDGRANVVAALGQIAKNNAILRARACAVAKIAASFRVKVCCTPKCRAKNAGAMPMKTSSANTTASGASGRGLGSEIS